MPANIGQNAITVIDINTLNTLSNESQQNVIRDLSQQLLQLDEQTAQLKNEIKVLSNQFDFYKALPMAWLKKK